MRILLEGIPEEARSYIETLSSENEELRRLLVEKERLVLSLGQLDAKCLALQASESQLYDELGRFAVSANQLSSSLSHGAVVQSIQEIVANLIGSESLSILSVEPGTNEVADPHVVSQWGVPPDWISDPSEETACVKEVLRTGDSFFAERAAGEVTTSHSLTACVALRAGEAVVGAIAIFDLLPQKEALTNADIELFELIASLGGQALYCSALHARAYAV